LFVTLSFNLLQTYGIFRYHARNIFSFLKVFFN